MTDAEKQLFAALAEQGVRFEVPTWEACRAWLAGNDWKINVLSDYPGGEVKFTVRHGFERIEVMGRSDLEVMAKAIAEIVRRSKTGPSS
jgi:hypothetical protein